MLIYCDTSALVKLVIVERETADFLSWLAELAEPSITSSVLARTELVRAVRGHGQEKVAKARVLLTGLSFVALDEELVDEAADAEPPALRSLDALHVTTAQRIGSTLGAVVTYDKRMIEAARAAGLTVHHPGA